MTSRILGVFLVLLSIPVLASAATISADLERRITQLEGNETIPVILNLADQVDLGRFPGGRRTAGEMIVALRETAAESQAPVLDYLATNVPGTPARSFWINNSIAVRVTPTVLRGLATFSEIASIEVDVPIFGPELQAAPEGSRETEWNHVLIGAEQIWSLYGLDGTGIVIGSMDSGVDIDHPALEGKWRGGDNSWVDIVNGIRQPYDDHGHGTCTIGIMVGGDGPGPFADDVGLAYGAQFISAKVLDENLIFDSVSIVIAGAQWMLDPDDDPDTDDFPHVINNSWGFGSETYTGFYASVQAWQTAGIIPVFAIGNSGPGAGTTVPPGNYNNTIGVGATNSSDVIWIQSSRGPGPVGSAFPSDRRKPDLCAPGVNIRSSYPGGGYISVWSGTSLASPHVAAAAAILLDADSELCFTDIQSILWDTSVDLGDPDYDYTYGYGRLDALAAVVQAWPHSTADGSALARGLHLSATPNPFTGQLQLSFHAGGRDDATLEVFDVAGRLRRSFELPVGAGSISWDGRGASGEAVPAGTYLVRFSSGNESRTGRVLRLR